MSGVFLSYSRADRDLAVQILQGLRALGVDVWWDEDLPGVDWQDQLELKAGEVAAVLVVWTPNSSGSRHVKDEARLGRRYDKLVNVVVGVSSPPFPYDAINALPLNGWTGREPDSGWTRTVQTIEELVVKAGGAKAGAFTGALARREAAVRDGRAAVAQALTAFQEAQALEGEATEAAETAGAAFNRAEAQHLGVVQMRPDPALLHVAQERLDAARADKDAADRALGAAKAELSRAARALTRAKSALEAGYAAAAAAGPAEAVNAPTPEATPVVEPPSFEQSEQAAPEPQSERTPAAIAEPLDGESGGRPGSKSASTSRRPLVIGASAGFLILVIALAATSIKSGVRRPFDGSWSTDNCSSQTLLAGAGDSTAAEDWDLKEGKISYYGTSDAATADGKADVEVTFWPNDGGAEQSITRRFRYVAASDAIAAFMPDGQSVTYSRCPR